MLQFDAIALVFGANPAVVRGAPPRRPSCAETLRLVEAQVVLAQGQPFAFRPGTRIAPVGRGHALGVDRGCNGMRGTVVHCKCAGSNLAALTRGAHAPSATTGYENGDAIAGAAPDESIAKMLAATNAE